MTPPVLTAPRPADAAPMPAAELCIANAHIVLPDRELHGAIHILDGHIAELTEGDTVPPGAIAAHRQPRTAY